MSATKVVKVVCDARYIDGSKEREVFKSTDEDFESQVSDKKWLNSLHVDKEEALIEYAFQFFLQERDTLKEIKFTIQRKD